MIESYLVLLSVGVLLVLLGLGTNRPGILFFALLLCYYFFGLIDLPSMLDNFINISLITLVLLLLVSLVLEKTLFVNVVAARLFDGGYKRSLLKSTLFTSVVSGFLNNTAVMASMSSVVTGDRRSIGAKYLLPLSYASIFGGMLTLIGTSTNLIVNSFVIERGLPSLALFDFFYVGIFVVIGGILSLLLFAPLLPRPKKEETPVERYFIETRVSRDSPLVGKSVADAGLRNLEYLFLAEILRKEHLISPVSPEEVIEAGDILIFSGDIKRLDILERFRGLELMHAQTRGLGRNLIEAIISHESNIIGSNIKEVNFRTRFDATVIAIKRGEQKLSGKLADITLEPGDRLVLAAGGDFYKRENIAKNFYFLDALNIGRKLDGKKSTFALLLFFGSITAAALDLFSLPKALFFTLAVFVLLGFITLSEIKRRFPFEIVLIIGSALGVAHVLLTSGSAGLMADALFALFGGFGVYGTFIGIYLFTLLLTEMVTNNAAAALAFPIAYSSALALDVSYLPFVMAVAFGASASFMTPHSYQTNLLAYSSGYYGFRDFLRYGAPISLVYSLICIFTIPLIFPF